MNVTFLTKPKEIEAEFDRILPVFERVPAVSEYTHKDLAERAMSGKMLLGYAEENGMIRMVMAFEFIHYPRMMAVNIIALAGEGLDEVADLYFGTFKAWCHMAGAGAIEALCGDPRMTRLLRRYGMVHTYDLVRAIL